jgi:hypothetical protein
MGTPHIREARRIHPPHEHAAREAGGPHQFGKHGRDHGLLGPCALQPADGREDGVEPSRCHRTAALHHARAGRTRAIKHRGTDRRRRRRTAALDAQGHRPQIDARTRAQLDRLVGHQRSTIDLGSMAAAEVTNGPCPRHRLDPRVPAADRRMIDHQRAIAAAADHGPALGIHHQWSASGRQAREHPKLEFTGTHGSAVGAGVGEG